MSMPADELFEALSSPLWDKDIEYKRSIMRKCGLTVDPKVDDPEHYFESEKEFMKSGKYYGYIKGQEGLISYRG